jgi:hypothetical protein
MKFLFACLWVVTGTTTSSQATLSVIATPSSNTPFIMSLCSANSINWTLTNTNLSISIPATVPGQTHLDLLAAGIISEPYTELAVDEQHWISDEEAWVWATTFTPPPALLAKSIVELISDGIDTVATVTLNDVLILSQSDAFLRTAVDVTALLVNGPNTLSIRISSPTKAALDAYATCNGYCPTPREGPPANASAYSVGPNYLRKPQVHFGWDFAPNFVSSGIWRDIVLRGVDGAVLEEVTVVTSPVTLPVPLGPTQAAWTTVVTAHIMAYSINVAATIAVSIDGITAGSTHVVLPEGATKVNVNLTADSVDAWWPSGLGKPSLYNASVTVTVDGTLEESTQYLKIGFRTVSLELPPAPDGLGSLYFFTINGRALIIKGANWVPADAFDARASSRAQFAPKLASFAAAHYNTLRVWGGGFPPLNPFFDLAQEMGFLVWLEQPYACSSYPTGGDLLANAVLATHDIVRRVQKYSILIWGGNNEIGMFQSRSEFPLANYSALFFGAIGTAVADIDTSRRYIPTSPGSATETPDFPIAAAISPFEGDMHVYEYAGNGWSPLIYPPARAVTEFGLQSYSNLPTMAEMLGPAGFDYWSAPVQRRDTHPSQPPQLILFHNIGQNWLIPGYNHSCVMCTPGDRDARLTGSAYSLAAEARAKGMTSVAYSRRSDGSYALPTDALGIVPMMSIYEGVGAVRGTIFRDTLLLTQLSQALSIKIEAEKYRRIQSECGVGSGGGCTSTYLYWMSADLWPGATKGSIEWSGRWKALHYEAMSHFFAPFLVSPYTEPSDGADAQFGVYVAAHPPAAGPVPQGLVRVTCWSFSDGHLGFTDTPFAVPSLWPSVFGSPETAGGSLSVINGTLLSEALTGCGCVSPKYAASDCMLSVAAYNASTPDTTFLLGTNELYPTPLKDVVSMRDPQLAITDVVHVAGSPGAFTVTLTAAHLPVAAVWIESLLCCGFFSANAFLMTEAEVVLTYTPLADARGWVHTPPAGSEFNVTEGQFAASLSLWSLWDTAAYDGNA